MCSPNITSCCRYQCKNEDNEKHSPSGYRHYLWASHAIRRCAEAGARAGGTDFVRAVVVRGNRAVQVVRDQVVELRLGKFERSGDMMFGLKSWSVSQAKSTSTALTLIHVRRNRILRSSGKNTRAMMVWIHSATPRLEHHPITRTYIQLLRPAIQEMDAAEPLSAQTEGKIDGRLATLFYKPTDGDEEGGLGYVEGHKVCTFWQ